MACLSTRPPSANCSGSSTPWSRSTTIAGPTSPSPAEPFRGRPSARPKTARARTPSTVRTVSDVPELHMVAGAADPFDERLAGVLMTVLYRSGRPADALAVYRSLERELGRELGVVPSPEVKGLGGADPPTPTWG
ncbi:MAG: BTAD domain-containing putative transcriptional regulator [Acidimicrobiales bacterium]